MLELPKKKSDSIADSKEKEEKEGKEENEDKWDENVKKATRTVKRTTIYHILQTVRCILFHAYNSAF